jgi:hypothetical protein
MVEERSSPGGQNCSPMTVDYAALLVFILHVARGFTELAGLVVLAVAYACLSGAYMKGFLMQPSAWGAARRAQSWHFCIAFTSASLLARLRQHQAGCIHRAAFQV